VQPHLDRAVRESQRRFCHWLEADDDGWIQALDVGGARWQAFACELANRPLTAQEWTDFVGDQRYQPVCGAGSTDSSGFHLLGFWH
jgi:hypothetical protein